MKRVMENNCVAFTGIEKVLCMLQILINVESDIFFVHYSAS
jgi:hypothetical protein